DIPHGVATVVHTPGHSPGHICLYFEGSRLLISGDQVITNGTVYVGEPLGKMNEYLRSMRKLLKYDVDTLAPGHGDVVNNGWRRILELHEYRVRREGEIIMALRTGPKTSLEVAQIIYKDRATTERMMEFGRRQTDSHLIALEERRLARSDGDQWTLV